MKSTLRISLKSGERIFINGAVLRVDRKVALEFLNDVTFLLENHVLQLEDATTPLRQLYFIAQMMLINPEGKLVATFRPKVAPGEVPHVDMQAMVADFARIVRLAGE